MAWTATAMAAKDRSRTARERKSTRPGAEAGRGVASREYFTMMAILRFREGVRRDPAIDVWLNEQPVALGSIARRWFVRMRDCGPDVRELVHDGCPVACVGDAPFAYVDVFRAHSNVGFFYGAELADPARLLEGTGKRMRHVTVKPDAALNSRALAALIAAAYVDIKRRLDLERFVVGARE
jgi:hypothetical protein